jgi:hypothetical protein
MRHQAPLLVVSISMLLSGCSQSVNPSGPSGVSPGDRSQSSSGDARATLQREVEGGSGGGSNCGATLCGQVFVTAGDASLNGNDPVALTSNPLNFSAIGTVLRSNGYAGGSDTPLVGGHFSSGEIQMTVSGGIGTVALSLNSQSTTREVAGSGPVTQTMAACTAANTTLTTTLELNLKYFGKTTITELHFVPCS